MNHDDDNSSLSLKTSAVRYTGVLSQIWGTSNAEPPLQLDAVGNCISLGLLSV